MATNNRKSGNQHNVRYVISNARNGRGHSRLNQLTKNTTLLEEFAWSLPKQAEDLKLKAIFNKASKTILREAREKLKRIIAKGGETKQTLRRVDTNDIRMRLKFHRLMIDTFGTKSNNTLQMTKNGTVNPRRA